MNPPTSNNLYVSSDMVQFSFIRQSPSLPQTSLLKSQPHLKAPVPTFLKESDQKRRKKIAPIARENKDKVSMNRDEWRRHFEVKPKLDIHLCVQLLDSVKTSALANCLIFDHVLTNVTDIKPDSDTVSKLATQLIERSTLKHMSPRGFRAVMTSLEWTDKTPFLSVLELEMSKMYYDARKRPQSA